MAIVCTTNDLKEKVVINICDARKLGYICDFGVDLCDGRLTSIVVSSDYGLFCFKRGEEITIKWDKIIKIGDDAILVDISYMKDNCNDNDRDECDCRKRKNHSIFR